MAGSARPPFRADHVGSLLRPPALKALRLEKESGRASAGELRAVEEGAIREVVSLQESVGLRGITDGELRRTSWHLDFLRELGGLSSQGQTIPVTFHGKAGDVHFTRPDLAVASRVTRPRPIFVDAFTFLASVVSRTPKLTIPSPCMLYSQVGRANFRSSWRAQGGYARIAEAIFNELPYDGFFLEFDDARSGDFAPLRFVPKHVRVVLGLVTTKVGTLERKDDLKRRLDEAAKYVPIEQVCLSPQCGFSSTVEGNEITVDHQKAKLSLCVELAREVWGGL